MDGYGPAEMRKDTLLADRPRLRMLLERLHRRCSSQVVLVTREVLNGNNGVIRECRIQGGKIPLRRVEGQRLSDGRKFYRGLATLESY